MILHYIGFRLLFSYLGNILQLTRILQIMRILQVRVSAQYVEIMRIRDYLGYTPIMIDLEE